VNEVNRRFSFDLYHDLLPITSIKPILTNITPIADRNRETTFAKAFIPPLPTRRMITSEEVKTIHTMMRLKTRERSIKI
jgi:hypothetical protein